jgi:hypothetical protein
MSADLRGRVSVTLLLATALFSSPGVADDRHALSGWVVKSAAEVNRKLQIVLRDGRAISLARTKGQCSFDGIQVAPDGVTVGWVGGGDAQREGDPACAADAQYVAYGPVVWRAGKIIHDFSNLAGEINWAFYDKGNQIAIHAGPIHFDYEQASELYDVATGRLLKSWGRSSNTAPPDWARGIIDY